MNRAELEAQVLKKRLQEQVAAKRAGGVTAPPSDAGAEVAAKYKNLFTPEPTLLQKTADVSARLAETPRGILDLPQTLGSLAGYGGEKLGLLDEGATDRTLGKPFTQREGAVKNFFDTATTPFINREENPVTRAIGTGLSWAMPLPISKVSKVATLPDVLMGGGAAAGEYLGGEVGEIGGGITGLLAGLLRGKIATPSVDKPTRQAETLTTNLLADTPDAQASITKALEEGTAGTLADLAESPNMYNVEKTLSADPAQSSLRDSINQAVAKSEADTVSKLDEVLPSDSPRVATAAAQKQLSDAELALGAENLANVDKLTAAEEAKKATAKALEAQMGSELSDSQSLVAALRETAAAEQGKVLGSGSPVEASKSIFDKYNILDKAMSKPMKEAYKIIDDAPKIDVSQAVKGLDDYTKTLDLVPTEIKNLKGTYGKHLDKIAKWVKNPVRPKEIQAVLSDMKQQIADASEGGIRKLPRTDNIANDIVKALETQLNTPTKVGGFSGFKDATSLAAAKFAATTPETVGVARKANVPETFTDTLSYTGKQGAQTARLAEASKDPAVKQAHFDVISAAAKEAGMYGGKGVDEAFMKKYSGFLDEYPTEKAKYQRMADANKAAAEGAKEGATTQKALTKALAASQKATTASSKGLEASIDRLNKGTKQAKAQVAKGTVETFAKEPVDVTLGLVSPAKDLERTAQLTELAKWSKAEGVEDSFKGQVKDVLMDRLFPEGGTGLRQATGASVKAFKPAKERLISSGILTRAEADAVEKALKTNAGRQAAREAAGLTEVATPLTPKQKQLAAAAAVAAVTTTGIPHALFAVGFTRRMIEQAMVNMKMSAEGKAKLAEFITNPEKYVEAYEMMKKINAEKGTPSAQKLANVARAVTAAGNINASSED